MDFTSTSFDIVSTNEDGDERGVHGVCFKFDLQPSSYSYITVTFGDGTTSKFIPSDYEWGITSGKLISKIYVSDDYDSDADDGTDDGDDVYSTALNTVILAKSQKFGYISNPGD